MITVEWVDAEPNIIIWRFTAPWSFDEFYRANEEVNSMIDSVEGHVDCIFVPSKGQAIPPQTLSHLRRLILMKHRRLRYMVILSPRVYLAALLNTLGELIVGFDVHIRIADTEDHAIQLIKELRTTSDHP